MLSKSLTAEEQVAMGQPFAYLQAGIAAGFVHLAGRTQRTGPETVGLCLFEALDQAAADAFTAADPAIAAGVVRAEVYPYLIGLKSPAWGG